MRKNVGLPTLLVLLAIVPAHAQDFDTFGSANEELVPLKTGPEFIFELGVEGVWESAYEGASTYALSASPIIGLERLHIPGFISLGGDEEESGFSFSPAFDMTGERKSANHSELAGLNDVAATYALGAKIGYDFELTDNLTAEVYGELLYGFGASQSVLGKVGTKLAARLTPELEIIGGAMANFASESYMDAYFGVTAAEAARTGGRLAAYDPSGGDIKSVSVSVSARYEIIPDTFLNAKGAYTRYVGSAASSPIVKQGSADQFMFGLGISRRFTVSY